MLCGVVTGPSIEEVENQIDQASKLADALEIRWDAFHSTKFKINSNLPLIFTLRPLSQGGFYKKSEKERLEEIEHLASLKPEFIDLEYNVSPEFIQKLRKNYPSIKIILSYHNYASTPHNLNEILASMKKTPADFYKIACMANSTLDALKMLIFSKDAGKEVIGLCMGEFGAITRIINHWSYACVDEADALVKGQLSLETLIKTYRFKSLNEKTAIYALIGDPVDKSVSHITHNKFFGKFKKNALYIKMRIKEEELDCFFKAISQLNFKGLSVTMPLKQAVIAFLNEINPKAKAISAVNTILIEDKKLIGFNTDCTGAFFAIEEKVPLKNKKVLIIGAGGASRAIVFETISKGAEVTVLNRTFEKALKMADEFGCKAASLQDIKSDYDILINCTPDEMPFDPCFIQKNTFVMDIKSFPKWTTLLKEAEKKNCTPIFGYDMFIHQAIGQFEIWFSDLTYCCKNERPSFRELFNLSEFS